MIQFDFFMIWASLENKNKIFGSQDPLIFPFRLFPKWDGAVPEEECEYEMFHCSRPPPTTSRNVSSQLTGEAAQKPPPTTNHRFFISKIVLITHIRHAGGNFMQI